MQVKTEFTFPPIPVRDHDWHAWIDGLEEDGFYGHGCTEKEAIEDLIEGYGDTYCHDCHSQIFAEDCSVAIQPHGERLLVCPCGSDNLEKIESD